MRYVKYANLTPFTFKTPDGCLLMSSYYSTVSKVVKDKTKKQKQNSQFKT